MGSDALRPGSWPEVDPNEVCFGLTLLTQRLLQRFLTLTPAKSAGSARDE